MKPLFPLLFTAGLVLCTACDKSKKEAAALPAPEVVGTWEWTDKTPGDNKVIQKWRLEIHADKTFRREITSLAKPQPQVSQGTWALGNVMQPEASKDDSTDRLMRNAGHDPSKEDTVSTGLANLSLSYSVPEGVEMMPGATVQEKPLKSGGLLEGKPRETPVEEKHLARTRSFKSSKDIYLDFGKKNYLKVPDAPPASSGGAAASDVLKKSGSQAVAVANSQPSPKKEPSSATESLLEAVNQDPAPYWARQFAAKDAKDQADAHAKLSSEKNATKSLDRLKAALAAAPATEPAKNGPAFAKVKPFGDRMIFNDVALELPRDWTAFNLAKGEEVALSTVGQGPTKTRGNSGWVFLPPGNVPDVELILSIEAPFRTLDRLPPKSQEGIDEYCSDLIKGAVKNAESQGYQLKTIHPAERLTVDGKPTLTCLGEFTDAKGGPVFCRVLCAATEAGVVSLNFIWTEGAGDSWKSLMEHARQTLAIGEVKL